MIAFILWALDLAYCMFTVAAMGAGLPRPMWKRVLYVLGAPAIVIPLGGRMNVPPCTCSSGVCVCHPVISRWLARRIPLNVPVPDPRCTFPACTDARVLLSLEQSQGHAT